MNKYRFIVPISFLFFCFSVFLNVSFYTTYAACGDFISSETVNCAGNTTTIVDPSPYGHFSNSAVGTAGTLSVSCEQRVLNTSQREVIYRECMSPEFGPCEANVQNTGTDVSCNVLTTCGNSVKEEFECCDGGANCNGSCQCVFSGSISDETSGFCGDGICSSGETCARDCSSTCNIGVIDSGPTDLVVLQGDSTSIALNSWDVVFGDFRVSILDDACPPGATCSDFSYGGGDYEIITGYEIDGTPIYDTVSGPYTAGANISTGATTPVGNYPIMLQVYDMLNPTTCITSIRKNLIVRPSRRTVCNGNWYAVAGDFVASQDPVGKYFSTPQTMNVFAPNAGTGRNINEQTCSWATAGQPCIWNMGWTNTSNFSSVVNRAVNIPTVATSRTAIASTLSNGMFQLGNSGWQVYSGPVPVWGDPSSTSDPYGRTYQFRRGSGSVVEYMCTANQPDLNVDTLSVIGTRNTGQSLGFRGTVRNTGNASTVDTSQSSLKIDIGNNGSWDVTVSPNQSTGVLAPSGSEIETWNSAWTATAGTHRFEICADETGEVTESNENNNCSLAGTGVFTVTAPNAVPDINVSPSTINSGQSSTVSWTSTGATSCAVSCSPAGSCSWTGTSGSQSSGALSANKTYTLTCQPGSTTDSATVTVNAASNPILNVIKSGQGTVTSSPAGISCGTDCSQAYVLNTSVTLTATPSAGRIFTGWSGHCTGRGTETSPGSGVFTCTLNINGDKSVTANFAIDPNYKEF